MCSRQNNWPPFYVQYHKHLKKRRNASAKVNLLDHHPVDSYARHPSEPAHNERGPGLVEVTAGTQRHHASQGAVQGLQEAPGLLEHPPSEDNDKDNDNHDNDV